MSETKITPHRVTKPIQLLAAWLTGLVVIEGAFLGAASTITAPLWVPGALVIAAILYVPVFLGCIFILQTRFRPEMQEDDFYSKYLDKRTNTIESSSAREISELKAELATSNASFLEIMESMEERLLAQSDLSEATSLSSDSPNRNEKPVADMRNKIAHEKVRAQWDRYSIQVNDLLPSYTKIRNILSEAYITIEGTFGTSSAEPKVPEIGVLAYSSGVDIATIAAIVKMLKGLGIDYISNTSDLYGTHRIYIGAYGYEDGNFVPIDGEVEAALLDQSMTSERFGDLITGLTFKYAKLDHS